MRDRRPGLTRGLSALRRGPARSRIAATAVAIVVLVAVATGCSRGPDPSLFPDSVLRAELGLTDADRVHRITLAGGGAEQVAADSVLVAEGDWVEFVATDWRTHEVRFEAEALGAEARSFLERSDQVASPPLMAPDARFVVSFRGAPEGRYPFRVEGNGAPGRGVVVVGSSR